jgi:RecA-family ATPase
MIDQNIHERDAYIPRVHDVNDFYSEEIPVFDIMNMDDIESLPDPEWLIHGVLPAESFAVLYGPPGSTKSFWALDAACCIATGQSLHGAYSKPGKVIIAVGEGLRGMKYRIEAWKIAHPDADLEMLRQNLIIIPRSVRILDQLEAARLVKTCEYVGGDSGLKLFVLDTWARAFVGGDENSARDAGIAVEVCETIRARTGATALVVHHSNADGQRERGSTALRGAADAQMSMTRDENSGVVTMKSIKIKDGSPFQDQHFVLAEYGKSAVLLPHKPTFPIFNGGQSTKPKFRRGEEPF